MVFVGPILVENKFHPNNHRFYLESDDFKCHCGFICEEHENLVTHLIRQHQRVKEEEIDFNPTYLSKKWPHIWKLFCELRDKRKHFICKPLISDNKIAVKVQYGHPLASLILDGYELTPQKLSEHVSERYEVSIPDSVYAPIDIYATKIVTTEATDPSEMNPRINEAQDQEQNDVVVLEENGIVIRSNKRYPLRSLFTRNGSFSDKMSFDIMNCLKSGQELPREVINYMYETGAFLILQDFPEGHEFGIDYKSWNVGEKFLGLKMIPPGVHFIYCSVKGAPRIGFFHNFSPREVLVKKWDKKKEDFVMEPATNEQIERIRSNLKNMDSCLGPYPYETYRMWYSLTDFITAETTERLSPEKGRISAQAELVSMETELMENASLNSNVGCSNTVDREHPTRTRFVDETGLPIMRIREGYQIRFKDIPALGVGGSRAGIDYSNRLEALISALSGDWKQLIAEVQFAFACFLVGQVYEGFEQWKRLIHLLCCCPGSFSKRADLFQAFIRVLFFQLKECPTDFFIDIVSRDNFLTTTLAMLFANIRDSDVASPELKKKSLQFKTYLSKTFKWDFECDD